jgi:conjugative transfer signal peptidase TraF
LKTKVGLFVKSLFARIRKTEVSAIRRLALLVFAILIGLFQICAWIGIRLNASPSLPIGLYVVSDSGRANLVEFCPAEPFATLAMARGYRDGGTCYDGGAPLMKPVVAKAGDMVELTRKGLAVNGTLVPNTAPLERDTRGRPLTPWPYGRYVVTRETVWVASSYNARSFDSRYFGPIDRASIRSHVRPLVTAW